MEWWSVRRLDGRRAPTEYDDDRHEGRHPAKHLFCGKKRSRKQGYFLSRLSKQQSKNYNAKIYGNGDIGTNGQRTIAAKTGNVGFTDGEEAETSYLCQ
jgi:hypothetical protein